MFRSLSAKIGLALLVMVVFAGVMSGVALADDDAVNTAIVLGGALGLFVPVGQYIGLALTGVGAASLLLQGIALIAGITPSTRDDECVGKIQRGLAKVQRVLDRLALNPSANKARRR